MKYNQVLDIDRLRHNADVFEKQGHSDWAHGLRELADHRQRENDAQRTGAPALVSSDLFDPARLAALGGGR